MATNAQVAHNWAHQTGKCQNGSSFSYYGTTLYSYNTAIGDIAPDGTVFLWNINYSNSTAKHLGHAWEAITHKRVLRVHHPKCWNLVEYNVEYWKKQVKAIKPPKSQRSHSRWIREVERHVEEARAYLDYMGEAYPEWLVNTIAEIERLRPLIPEKVVVSRNSTQPTFEEILAKWRAGQRQTVPGADGLVYLRILKSGAVQTSKGITLSQDTFLEYYYRLVDGRLNVGDTVMSFKVYEITADKIVIGCHNITREELNLMFHQLTN